MAAAMGDQGRVMAVATVDPMQGGSGQHRQATMETSEIIRQNLRPPMDRSSQGRNHTLRARAPPVPAAATAATSDNGEGSSQARDVELGHPVTTNCSHEDCPHTACSHADDSHAHVNSAGADDGIARVPASSAPDSSRAPGEETEEAARIDSAATADPTISPSPRHTSKLRRWWQERKGWNKL